MNQHVLVKVVVEFTRFRIIVRSKKQEAKGMPNGYRMKRGCEIFRGSVLLTILSKVEASVWRANFSSFSPFALEYHHIIL